MIPHLLPLITKPLNQWTPEEYHAFVKGMYQERAKAASKSKKPSFAAGLTLSRTKKGALSLRLNKKLRPFQFILDSEIDALAVGYAVPKAEVWNLFKARKFIIAKTRMDAERTYANINNIPWG